MEECAGVTDSPKKGPTLSTSTSSFEALDPHDPNLSRLATKMFQKTGDFISSELTGPLEDYKLLENMNRATISKYSDMQQITENLSASTAELNVKLEELMPYLQQIDEIDATVTKIEVAAYKLDAYTQQLEAKFKSLTQKK
ncbi:biogenesis of lysosome-related organelles complex 1 subunit 2 [Lutzomyia longipalpis]|uniref:Putative bioproteinis of lysosome-related organelles complex 1 subunit 2 isoform x2 n=1 Tax=Lutzomyia longipalpis TaxID=7200 RepID=A0A1B0CG40_LUTLO|nr:biogenesis of lysosome-related organelles complex 1 subunit 2 [Lutzomyia longipalpis]